MKIFENLSEAKSFITSFIRDQKWATQIKNNSYCQHYKTLIYPEKPLLNYFNKVSSTASSYTFSRIFDRVPRENHDSLITAFNNGDIEFEKFELMTEDINQEITLPQPTSANQWLTIFESFFSPSYLSDNNINLNTLNQLLNQEKEEKVMRWQEIRHDLRTILSFSLYDHEVQISFCDLDKRDDQFICTNWNPVTAYYEGKFLYRPKFFDRFCTRHDVTFMEWQGYPQYPLAHLNEQVFNIQFNEYSEGKWDRIFSRSLSNLKKELNNVLSNIYLTIGKDIQGNFMKELKTLVLQDPTPQEQKDTKVKKMYGESLYFYTPENDIFIYYGPIITRDYNGTEFLIYTLRIRVVPFDNQKKWDERDCYAHPLVYEMGK
jgi:hypothetical protein